MHKDVAKAKAAAIAVLEGIREIGLRGMPIGSGITAQIQTLIDRNMRETAVIGGEKRGLSIQELRLKKTDKHILF